MEGGLSVALNKEAGLKWILLCLGLKVLCTSACLPILPYFATEDLLGGSDELGYSIAIFGMSQMLSTIFLSRLSDCIGRRYVLLFMFFISPLGFYVTYVSNDLNMFYLSRGITGLASGSISVVSAMICDVCTVTSRPLYNGMIGAIIGFGFVLGPACGGLILVFMGSRRYVILFTVVAGLLTALLALLKIPETHPLSQRVPLNLIFKPPQSSNNNNMHTPSLILILIARISLTIAVSVMGSSYFLTIQQHHKFENPDKEMARILTITGTAIIFYQALLFRFLHDKIGIHKSVALGAAFMSLGLYLIHHTIERSLHIHLFAYTLSYAVGYSLVEPGIPTLTSLYASRPNQGLAHGLVNSSRFLAAVIGPLINGMLFLVDPKLPFYFSTLSAAVSVLFIVILAKFGRPVNTTGNNK